MVKKKKEKNLQFILADFIVRFPLKNKFVTLGLQVFIMYCLYKPWSKNGKLVLEIVIF